MPENDQQPEPQHQPSQESAPWGEDFDPARAWRLVENLREDNARLKSRPALTEEQQAKLTQWEALEEASKTELERLQEAYEAERRAREADRAEAARYKAAATFGIPADAFDLLGSGTYEEIAARAEKIAALHTAAQAAATPAPPAPAVPQRRPVEQLRPGATPGGVESEQDVIYTSLFGN